MFGNIDEVLRRVDQENPDRAAVRARVYEVIAAMELMVDEASGDIVRPVRVTVPRQTNVGSRGRY